ncbi:hypothetical protein ABC270_07995 [Curtobacterium sp. 1P10AnD]|uniref:hypothetical protein n=1 Tax=Curtobacterium sp. 1P10AnD TaxID=3132283 RepID=UPI00399F345E
MAWTNTDPGQGDPAAVSAIAASRRDKADDLRDTARSLRVLAHDGQTADWRGRAKEPFQANVGAFTTDVGTLAVALDEQASALETYATALTAIQEDQRDLETRRASAAQALTDAQAAASSARSEAQDAARSSDSTPEQIASASSIANRRADDVSDAVTEVRSIDLEWDALVERRRAADRACADALDARAANGLPKRLTDSDIASATPLTLLALLQSMSADDAAEFLRKHPDVAARIETADPGAVRAWWESLGAGDDTRLSAEQSALVAAVPAIIGALNGVPAQARVAANRSLAADRLEDAKARLAALQLTEGILGQALGHGTKANRDEIAALQQEIDYLEGVVKQPPEHQLYLYDPSQKRIIEMYGTPAPDTKHVITYVPGTFSNMEGFYNGGIQQVGKWLHDNITDGTVVFVAKDGVFPGEQTAGVGGIQEANDPQFALGPAERLRQLAAGISTDPNMTNALTTAIGHSWGTANITTSETLGAMYNQVDSLSGAGMPQDWKPNALTEYKDYSYVDILQVGQATRHVWDGNNPRWNPAFEHDAYYGPKPDDINPYDYGYLLDEHNRVARINDNRAVLDDLRLDIAR